jgi:hypothetical protein
MNSRTLLISLKWIGYIFGYLVASLLVAILGSVVIMTVLSKGNFDDAPGTGLLALLIAGQLFAILLLLGFLLLIELLYSRFIARSSIDRVRAVRRELLGLLSMAALFWNVWIWPFAAHNTRFRSQIERPLILGISGLALLLAIGLPFGRKLPPLVDSAVGRD